MNDAASPAEARAGVSPRFRLALRPAGRYLRSVGLVLAAIVLVAMAAGPDVAAGWRLFSVAGAVSCVVSLRIVLGPAVVVRPEGLRVQPSWPFRRDIAWYRILDVEVVPVLWVLDIELNNGQHVQLPAVERLNELYDLVEAHRHDLDG